MTPRTNREPERRFFRVSFTLVVLLSVSHAFGQTWPASVLLHVTDKNGVVTSPLEPATFSLKENGKAQAIVSIDSALATPLSLIVAVDLSGSTRDQEEFGQKDLLEFFNTTIRPDRDGAGVVVFNLSAALVQGLTGDATQFSAAVNSIDRRAAFGGTALYDTLAATARGLGTNTGRKAIVLLSDGEDTASRISPDEISRLLQRQGIMLYVVATVRQQRTTLFGSPVSGRGIETIAESTGGFVLRGNGQKAIRTNLGKISEALNSVYVLHYDSEGSSNDSKSRKIQVTSQTKEFRLRHSITPYADPVAIPPER